MVRPFFGDECLGKPYIPARDSYYNFYLTMESLILRVVRSPQRVKFFSSILSFASYQFLIVFSLLYFVVVVVVSIWCLFSATSISM